MSDQKTKKKFKVEDLGFPQAPDAETTAYWSSFGGKIVPFFDHFYYKRVAVARV